MTKHYVYRILQADKPDDAGDYYGGQRVIAAAEGTRPLKAGDVVVVVQTEK